MTTALTLHTSRRPDGAVVVAAIGEIDMSNTDAFAAALTDAQDGVGGGTLLVDLTRVEYIDSAGLAVLFPYVQHLRLLAAPLLVPVLTVAGLDDLTTIQEQ
jgi:anti-sigma B factor antagonist